MLRFSFKIIDNTCKPLWSIVKAPYILSKASFNGSIKNIIDFRQTFGTASAFCSKYSSDDQKFSSGIIYDYDEEMELRELGLWEDAEIRKDDPNVVTYQRGEFDVFDLDELVQFLREQKASDIAVIQVCPESKFCDYMVIVSGKSRKHINAIAEHLKKVYKKKRRKSDGFITLEGKGSDWVAVDMGSVILHVMEPELRKTKDLESLWTVGASFEEGLVEESGMATPIHELLKFYEITPHTQSEAENS